MAKNIPSNENQRPATETTLPSKALNQDRRPNKQLPRQKKPKRIHLHRTSSATDAKGTALRKGRKRERQRGTQVQKDGNEYVPINNNLKCKWFKCFNQKT